MEGESAPETEFSFLLRGASGAPMPEDSDGNTKIITVTGASSARLGAFTFTEAGIYTYTISELNTGGEGWSYDSTVYTLTYTVTLENGELSASYTLTDADGQPADTALFTNSYDDDETPVPDDDTVVIEGEKTWNHGMNPEENRPESIVVEVYANGELAVQWLVTEAVGWQYAFELPRYAQDGSEIVYTVNELAVNGYETEIDGYNIINTYIEESDEPETDTEDSTGDGSGTADTPEEDTLSQTGQLLWPIPVMTVLGAVLLLTGLKLRRSNGRRCRHGRK